MDKQPVKRNFATKIINSTLPGAIASVACAVVAVVWIMYFQQQGEVTETSGTVAIIVCLLIGIVACLISIMLPRNLANRATKTLEVLGRAVYRSSTCGEINISDELRKTVKVYSSNEADDEITAICKAFIETMDGHAKRVAILDKIAQGDLTQSVFSMGEQDAIGNAINNVISRINQIVREVKDATAQFAVGIREMSNGAQSLSQSSSEQATTVDQLLITVGDIAAEAEANAEKASEASRLAGAILSSAGDGRKQMENMSVAMREITDANHSIGNVMRAIDEIAFQTNILALNAAVEAARAGVHGRGFAVVADEVRNLANKSGSAAGESNAVIVDTISKSDEGMKMVEDILAFFRKIEESINTTSSLLDEIAYTAQKQSDSIDMVNNFIANLTDAVLLNNATSEQSAAASEEMSSQATMLEESVNRFKLRDDHSYIAPRQSINYNIAPVPKKVEYLQSTPAPAIMPKPVTVPAKMPAPVTGGAGNASIHSHYNPVNEPAPEAGGRTPAEIYAEALGKPASAASPSGAQTALPSTMATVAPVTHEGFVDDESKY